MEEIPHVEFFSEVLTGGMKPTLDVIEKTKEAERL
jgi:hypothetical protein